MDLGIVGSIKEQGADYLGNVVGQVNQVNWNNPTWDLFFFLFFVCAVVLFMFSLSRERIFTSIISTYVALSIIKGIGALTELFALVSHFWLWQVLVFLGILIILTALFSRLGMGAGTGLTNLWQVFYFSVLQTGLLMAIIISFLPQEIVSRLLPLTRVVFSHSIAQTGWFLLPVISLLFIRRK